MRCLSIVVLLLLSQPAAYAQESVFEAARPALFLDGEPLPSVILNPTPPRYGMDEEGGCIPSDEFRVDLTDLVVDASGRLRLTGTVTNADPQRQDPQVIRVATRQGGAMRDVYTAVGGQLDLAVDAGESAVLVLGSIGYRALEVDLNQLASIARRHTRQRAAEIGARRAEQPERLVRFPGQSFFRPSAASSNRVLGRARGVDTHKKMG